MGAQRSWRPLSFHPALPCFAALQGADKEKEKERAEPPRRSGRTMQQVGAVSCMTRAAAGMAEQYEGM